MINLEDITFKYKDSGEILKNISFSINDGEIVAIVGKNGSGKSTLGKVISGIIKLKKGKIIIDGEDITKKTERIRDKVGIVFQNPETQIIFNNIYDELSFSIKNIPKYEISNRIEKALIQVDMIEHKESNLYNLSLGQKQRMMIAEILIKNSKYIILDEPTTMIDSLGKEKIYEIIKNLKSQGYTIVLITNVADEIVLADRIFILDKGNIVSEIKKEELLDKKDILEKYDIKLPTIVEIASSLEKDGIKLDLKEYTKEELVCRIKEKIGEKNEKHS